MSRRFCCGLPAGRGGEIEEIRTGGGYRTGDTEAEKRAIEKTSPVGMVVRGGGTFARIVVSMEISAVAIVVREEGGKRRKGPSVGP